MARSPLDFPCPSCGVSAGRYCDGADTCRERVAHVEALEAAARAKAEERRAIEEETVRRCAEWLRLRGDAMPASREGVGYERAALYDAADELSLEVLP